MTANDRMRDSHGHFAADGLPTAELDAEAARLRSRGMTYRQIAQAMHCDVHTAHNRVERALKEVRREPAQELVELELAKLDRMERAALEVLESFHYVVSEGRVVKYKGPGERTPQPLKDTGPVMAAINALVKISESRRKLLGLDAATKVNVSGGVTYRFEGGTADDL